MAETLLTVLKQKCSYILPVIEFCLVLGQDPGPKRCSASLQEQKFLHLLFPQRQWIFAWVLEAGRFAVPPPVLNGFYLYKRKI